MLTRILGLVGLAAAFLAFGQSEGQEARKIVEVRGETAVIKVNEIAHIRPAGIAGAKVEAEVKGPAKHSMKNIPVKIDGQIVVGPSSEVIEIVPTGKGTVEVQIRVTNPNAKETTKSKVTIEVK